MKLWEIERIPREHNTFLEVRDKYTWSVLFDEESNELPRELGERVVARIEVLPAKSGQPTDTSFLEVYVF